MSAPRICVVGLGAIGGLLAARLAHAGLPVSALARGATLEAVRRDGLQLIERASTAPAQHAARDDGARAPSAHARGGPTAERVTRVRIDAADSPQALGTFDVVIVSVKTTALAQVAPAIAQLAGERGAVLSAMNGVPWWFFHGLAPELAAIRLRSIDPAGEIARLVPPERVVGCVTHLSASTAAPGVVRHGVGDRLIVGEPTGGCASARAVAIVEALERAGFSVDRAPCIQQDVWFKLWGNMTMNPVSAITGATADRILDDALVRGFLSSCMREASAIGARIGLPIADDPESRHAVTRKLGAFRTSMLQDVDAGRPVELDALVAAVAEIGDALAIDTPSIDALYGLARLHARVRGLYPE